MGTNLDNAYTLLFKNVPVLNSPTRYIILFDEYISLQQMASLSLSDLYSKFVNQLPLKDVITSYFYFNAMTAEVENEINEYIGIYNEANLVENPQSIIFPPYTPKELVSETKFWKKAYDLEYKEDLKRLKKIESIQKNLLKWPEQEIKDLTLHYATFEYQPKIRLDTEKIKGKTQQINVDARTGILIFDEVKVSRSVPYVQLNNYDGEKYFKIYDADNFKDIGKIINTDKYDKPNSLYFIVLTTKEYGTVKDTSYEDVLYNLETNKLSFRCKEGDQNDIIRELRLCFRGFTFTNVNSKKYRLEASMVIYKFNVDPSVMHFLFTNEEEILEEGILSAYFFIDETDYPISERNDLIMKYKTISAPTDLEDSNPSSASVKMINQGENMIVQITKAESEDVLVQFIDIFTRVLSYYKNYEEDIKLSLDRAVPPTDITPTQQKRRYKTKIIQEVYTKKIDQLRALSGNSDIFKPGSDGYSRRCNCQKQPIIIEEDEKEDWNNKTFIENSEKMYRQIGVFPPNSDDPNFGFVCPDDEYPYPTVIENKDASTNKQYAFIPCCAKTDSISNPKSDYNKYGKTDVKSVGSKTYALHTYKTLDYGRMGILSPVIENILNIDIEEDNKIRYSRFGVGTSYNSLIHCLLTAVKEKKYKSIPVEDYGKKQAYCVAFRNEIIEKLPNYYNVSLQENYDVSPKTLREYILDPLKFFNDTKFYRILEELFNVNIYVFTNREEGDVPGFSIPNHTLVHIRPFNKNRKTVLILKNEGVESETLDYPVYELIVNTNTKISSIDKNIPEITYFFNSVQSENIHKVFNQYRESYIFGINGKEVESRINPYSEVLWPDILKDFTLVSQKIDSYGKLRCINIRHSASDMKMSLFTPPGQPLNLEIDDNIYITETKIVKDVFGEPVKEINGGFWYSIIDYKYGLFVPCNIKADDDFPASPFSEQIKVNANPISDYREKEKYSKMLLDFIKWGLRSNGILNLTDFKKKKNKFIIRDDTVEKGTAPVKLISYITDKGDFTYIANIWPEYFKTDNTVHLYSELYDKIIQYLERYYIDTDGLSLPPDPYLKGTFKYEWDFKPFSQNRVLIGIDNLKKWLTIQQKNFKGEMQVSSDIKIENLGNKEDPFLYKTSDRMYLIQNVREGDLNKALNCAEEWRLNKINLGFDSPNDKYKKGIQYVVFQISASYDLFESRAELTSETTDYVSILQFNDSYAAMLDIY